MDTTEFLNTMRRANEDGRSVNSLSLMKAMNVEKAAFDKSANLDYGNPASADATTGRDGSPRVREDYISGSDGYTMTPEGPVQNHNKKFNDLNGQQFQELTSEIHNSRVYRDEATGEKYQLGQNGERIGFEGETGFVYANGARAQDNGEDVNKLGYSRYGIAPRYNEDSVNKYGWEAGPGGIDTTNPDMNWELPVNMAKGYEELRQGNKYVNQARVSHDDGSQNALDKRAIYGGGTSEYTRQNETPLFNQDIGKGVEGTVQGVSAKDFLAQMKAGNNVTGGGAAKLSADDEYLLNGGGTGTSYLGQLADLTQASLARQGAGLADAAATAFGRVIGDEEGYKNVKLWGLDKGIDAYKDVELTNKEFGVSKSMQERQQRETQAAAKKIMDDPSFSNIVSGIATIGMNAPEIFAESAGEMVSIMFGPVGIATAVANRVNNDREEFIKNNGKAPDGAHEAGSIVSNGVALLLEKLFLKGIAGPAKKALAPLAKKVEGNIAGGMVKAMGSAGMEGAQEYVDGVQQDFFTMKQAGMSTEEMLKKAAFSEEAFIGAITGFGAGAGMGVGANIMAEGPKGALKGAGAAYTANKNRMENNVQTAAGEYTTDEDAEFIKANFEVNKSSSESAIKKSENVKTAIGEATNFDEMKASSNDEVRKYAETMEDASLKEVGVGSPEHKDSMATGIRNIIESMGEAKAQAAFSTRGIDVAGKTDAEIRTQLDGLDVQTIEAMAQSNSQQFGTDTASKRQSKKILDSRFDSIKENLVASSDLSIKDRQADLEKIKKTESNFNKGLSNRGKTLNTTIDIDTIGKDAGATKEFLQGMYETVTGKSKGVQAVNRYSDEAISNAVGQVDARLENKNISSSEKRRLGKIKRQLVKVQKKRVDSKKRTGLDSKSTDRTQNLGAFSNDKQTVLHEINKSLFKKEITDKRDVTGTQELLDSAESQGFITPEQKAKYEKRLAKIGKNAQDPTPETLAEEAKQEKEYQEKNDLSDLEMENKKKNIITEDDVEAESKDLERQYDDLEKENQDFVDEVENIAPEDYTDDQNERKEKIDKKMNVLLNKEAQLVKKKYHFTQADMEANNEYGKMDEYFEGVKETNVKDFVDSLTDAQREILNICK